MKQEMSTRLPVTVLSGFLVPAKQRFSHHTLNNKDGRRVAVIVNDMAELNIDEKLIKQKGGLRKVEERWLRCRMVASVARCGRSSDRSCQVGARREIRLSVDRIDRHLRTIACRGNIHLSRRRWGQPCRSGQA